MKGKLEQIDQTNPMLKSSTALVYKDGTSMRKYNSPKLKTVEMENKQTAVDWLDRWFRDNPEATHEEGNKALQHAKQMEKEQAITFAQWMHDYKGDINKVEELFEQFKNQ